MVKESLYIKRTDTDGNEQYFPSASLPAVIGTFTYSADRMGSAPTISATLMFPRCLDDEWTRKEYVEYNGEKYYVSQIPSSSKDNTDARYKHEITFTSERIVLENVYFLDVVTSDTETAYKDRYRSNSSSLIFYGDIEEFVARINDSLIYSGLYDKTTGEGYHVVIDDGITSDTVEVSFDDLFITEALQEIYNTYELTYYWVGKTCHVGYTENAITETMEYGSDAALLSVSKTNSNYRLIDRITGRGGSDNIPYYYPNTSSVGSAKYTVLNIEESDVEKVDLATIMGYLTDYEGVTFTLCTQGSAYSSEVASVLPFYDESGNSKTTRSVSSTVVISQDGEYLSNTSGYFTIASSFSMKVYGHKGATLDFSEYSILASLDTLGDSTAATTELYIVPWEDTVATGYDSTYQETSSSHTFVTEGYYRLYFRVRRRFSAKDIGVDYIAMLNGKLVNPTHATIFEGCTFTPSGDIIYTLNNSDTAFFTYGDDGEVSYSTSGITLRSLSSVPSKTLTWAFDTDKWVAAETGEDTAAKITVTGRVWITPSDSLMPPIYRETSGAERFYNAENDKYTDPATGDYYVFSNLYDKSNPHEGIEDFDDIYPTIKGITNSAGDLIAEILDVAFDTDDSDVLKDGTEDEDSDGDYLHSYFYIKLRVFDGDYGFNLFTHASASDTAVINMTSGNCSACAFEIAVEKELAEDGESYVFYNPVITDTDGNLKKVASSTDDTYYGDYILPIGQKSEYVARQQDTSQYEVWIAVKKENSTFGVVMPNASNNYKPSVGDSFVLTGITMPDTYITAAESSLYDSLIKHMKANNDEKFTFSITFSRIWIAQHEDIAALINENARLLIRYNGNDYTLYVSNYTCKADDNILYEITVDLTDELTVSQSSLLTQVDAVKSEIMSTVGSIDFLKQGLKYFIRKDVDDTANGLITFMQGLLSRGNIRVTGNTYFGQNFVSGIAGGIGGRIDSSANAELQSLILRSFLEVPELRYNRTEITLGDRWSAPGGGIVESVEVESDTSGVVTLKLEDGEIGAVAVGDICMGYFHNFTTTSENATEDYDDGMGNRLLSGFCTIYFRVTEILDTSTNGRFRYTLRPVSDSWAYSFHPQEALHFVAYGSFSDTARQTSMYSTRTYTRLLKNVSYWTFDAGNVASQWGDLSNLNVFGLDMSGYSLYLNSVYFTGTIKQVEDLGYSVTVTQERNGILGRNDTETVTMSLRNSLGAAYDGDITWKVLRDTGDTESDTIWNEAHTDTGGTLTIAYTDLNINSSRTDTTALFTAVATTDTQSYTRSFAVAGVAVRNIEDVANYYAVSTSGTEAPTTGWTTDPSTLTWNATNKYMWGYEEISYNDGSDPTESAKRVVAVYSEGTAGNGIKSITDYYLKSSQSTGITTATTGWTTDPPTLDSTERYLWNYEVIEFTSISTPYTSTPAVIGVYGDGGVSIEIDFASFTHKYGVSEFFYPHIRLYEGGTVIPPDDGNTWSCTFKTKPTYMSFNEYGADYGEFEGHLEATQNVTESVTFIVTYNGTEYYKTMNITTVADGEDGKGITSADVVYALSESDTDTPSSWVTDMASLTVTEASYGYYVWSCVAITYEGETSAVYTGAYVLGQLRDISTFEELYILTSSGTDAPSTSATGWMTAAEYEAAVKTKGYWLWTCTRYRFLSNTEYSYSSPVCGGYISKDGTSAYAFVCDTEVIATQQGGGDLFYIVARLFKGESDVGTQGWAPLVNGERAAQEGEGYENDDYSVYFSTVSEDSISEYYELVVSINTSSEFSTTFTLQAGLDQGEPIVAQKEIPIVATAKGAQGEQGIQGMITRVSVWAEGTEYHNDEALTTTPRYLDVVLVENSATTTGYDAYRCLSTHTATTTNAPNGGTTESAECWAEMTNIGAIYTSLIVAKNAVLKFSQSNRLAITGTDGSTVQACFTGVESEDDYMLWIGGATAAAAKYKVKYDGSLEATSAKITGEINASSGTIGGFEIGTDRIGYDSTSSYLSGMSLTQNFITFKETSYSRYALLGTTTYLNSYVMLALADNGSSNSYSYGARINMQGLGQNTAIDFNGGFLSGVAMRITYYSSATTATIARTTMVASCSHTSGTLTLTLPAMHWYDEGHIVIIKILEDGDLAVKSGTYTDSGGTSYNTYMLTDTGTAIGSSGTLTEGGRMNGMMFVFHREITATVSSVSHHGCWVQFKFPRNW